MADPSHLPCPWRGVVWKGGKVERWKGAPETSPPGYFRVIPGSRGPLWGGLPGIQSFGNNRGPRWGWQNLLPQRPEASPKQATPLPLPNGLRQPEPGNKPRPAPKQVHQVVFRVIPGSRGPLWGGLPGIQSFGNCRRKVESRNKAVRRPPVQVTAFTNR